MTKVVEKKTRRMRRRRKPSQVPTEYWREYKRTHSQEMRNHIIESYLPLVRYVAETIAQKLPQHVDTDDLISAGTLGLFKAVESFDVERGFKFETYSAQRVRGAILDDLRANDWVPRLVRQKMQRIGRARRRLQGLHHRPPTRTELADELELDADGFDKLERETRHVNISSLSETRPELNEHKDLRKIDVLCDTRVPDPVETLQRRDAVEHIVKNLDEKERRVLILYYFENLTMKEIGKVIGLSESRVSQIHKELCAKKRQELAKRQEDFALS